MKDVDVINVIVIVLANVTANFPLISLLGFCAIVVVVVICPVYDCRCCRTTFRAAAQPFLTC